MGMMITSRVLVVVSFLLVAAAMSSADDSVTPLPDAPLAIGVSAPTFTVTTLDGNTMGLETWRGRVVVLNCFTTWYRDAAQHMAVMEALATRHGRRGLRLLSVSLDEGRDATVATQLFAGTHNIAHPVATDPQQQLSKLYGVRETPAVFVIDRAGKIAGYHEGYTEGDEAKIEQMIVATLGASAAADQPAEAATDEVPVDAEPVCKCFKQSE